MKKSFYPLALISLALATSCSPAASSSDSSSELPSSESTSLPSSESSSSSSEEQSKQYKVTVLLPDGSPAAGVMVQWCFGTICLTPQAIDANGVATLEEVEEDTVYDVHLLKVPDGYTYNPAGYSSSAENPDITITLSKILTPTEGDGHDYPQYDEASGKFVGGPYTIQEGVYRTTIASSSQDDIVYYGFTPSKPGIYTMESWVDMSAASRDKNIDPWIGSYGNSVAFLYLCDEDEDSGVGKNFKYTFEVTPGNFETAYEIKDGNRVDILDENGDPVLNRDADGNLIPLGTFAFGLSAKSAASYNFCLSYDGEYVAPEKVVEIMHPEATLTKYGEGVGSLKNMELDGSQTYVYNPLDGFYHLNNASGPVIVVHLSSPSKYIDLAIKYLDAQGGNPFVVDNGTKDYSEFVAEYCKYTNSDGVYPLNSELVEFLQLLCIGQAYLVDGGWITYDVRREYGSTVQIPENANVMWACAYYLADGTADLPREITLDGEDKYLIEELGDNESIYYSFKARSLGEVTITPDEDTALVYDGNSYTTASPLKITLEVGKEYVFSVSMANKKAGTFLVLIKSTLEDGKLKQGHNTVLTTYEGVDVTFTGPGSEMIVDTYHIYSDDPNCIISFLNPVTWQEESFIGGSENNGFEIGLAGGEDFTFNVAYNGFELGEFTVQVEIDYVAAPDILE